VLLVSQPNVLRDAPLSTTRLDRRSARCARVGRSTRSRDASYVTSAVPPCSFDAHRFRGRACEKGIKALGQILWKGSPADDGRFRQHFLHRHSPLKQLSQEVAADAGLPKSLRLLLRQLDAELGELDGAGLLRKVDSTTPTTDPTDASYRYPFRGPAGEEVAPVDWSSADWDRYQGNSVGVAAAIDRFLRTVENRRQRGRAMT